MLKLISWLISTQTGKATAVTSLGGTGVLAIVFSLHTDVKQEMKETIARQQARERERIELILEPIRVELKNINKNQEATNKSLISIEHHLRNK